MATKKKVARKPAGGGGKVSTNFKQNHKRKGPGTAGGARARSGGGGGGGRAGRTQADFDPDQNVRQVNEDMAAAPEAAQALGSAMPASEMAAMPSPTEPPSELGQRSIPRYPDDEMV